MSKKRELLTWINKKVKLSSMVEWDKNPRRLTAQQADALRDSIKKFGYVEPIVLDADEKTIIGGHQRRRVLMQRLMIDGDAMVDVRVASRPLTQDEQEELAIRLNRNTGEWDFDLLANEFEQSELYEWGFTPRDFGLEDTLEAKGKGGKETKDNICPKCKRPL